MSTRLNHLKVALLMAAIASLMALTGCQPEGMALDPQTGRLATVTPPASPLQTPPLQAATLGPSQPQTRMPRPTPGPALPSVTPAVFPTLSPWPTFTPWPTPTRRPGPMATALPLPQPAKDATGTIFYAVRTDFSSGLSRGDIHRSQVDSVGNLSAVAQPTGIGWLRAYPSWDYTLIALVDGVRQGNHRVYILNPLTSQMTPVEESMYLIGRFLGWHPNNQAILYRVEGGEPETGLWLINIGTGEQTIVVLQNPLYIRDASMSPDGQRIVYSYQKGFAPGQMWTVNADGSDPELLFDSGGTMFGLTWSPDGSKIAFVDQSQGLVVMNPDGTDRRVVASDFAIGFLFEPVWSPDSRYLAYVAFEPELVPSDIVQQGKTRQVQDWDREAFLGSNIHIIDISDGQERTLVSIQPTGQIEGNIDPVWSPDGKLLAFAALREGQAGLWVVNVDGTGLRQLAGAPNLIRFPVWTR